MSEWRAVSSWESWYEVCDTGHVRSLDRHVPHPYGGTAIRRGRVLRPSLYRGYPRVNLRRPELSCFVSLHHLVLFAFIGPRPEGMEALHGDGDRLNARASNLRWGTRSENVADAISHGTHEMSRRAVCPRDHALIEPNLVIHKLRVGRRGCCACKKARDRIQRYPYLDMQAESDHLYASIMAGAAIGTGRHAAGRIPAQHTARPDAQPTRAKPAPSTAPTGAS